ncbi:hypothetical protein PGT21_014319 [Puccinia graminis f. sp. tritici]|uniref:Uncharacterized protein n=1 Tax=Puccinia graminis f. sp. tritici TaxID=56615 RepID=A0A5B0MEM8_PUCGR|nr:hypothetical protein PGT21_014319 [Puccinia graminis f. sp. tritici]
MVHQCRSSERSNLPSTGLTLSPTGSEPASKLNPRPLEPEIQEIDFLGSWGKNSFEQSGSNQRPLYWDHISEIDEDDDRHLYHREKRLKVQPAQDPRTLDLLQNFQLDRAPATIASSSSHHSPAVSRLEIPISHSSSDGARQSIERVGGDAPQIFHQANPIDSIEGLNKDTHAESSGRSQERQHEASNPAEASTFQVQENANLKKDFISLRDIHPITSTWIYSVKLGVTDSLYKEITDTNEKDISSFIKSLALKLNPSMNENQQAERLIEELTSPESSNNLKEFVHLLWCINSMFIASFKRENEHYISEQLSVQAWLLNLVEESGKRESVSMQAQDAEESLINLLRKALASRYSAPTYSMYKNLDTVLPNGAVCPSQLLMTETVINILASYYKSQNLNKWKSLFKKDMEFVDALKRSRGWNPRPSQIITKPKTEIENKESIDFFPWNERIPDGSMIAIRNQRTLFFGGRGKFDIEGRVMAMESLSGNNSVLMIGFVPRHKWLSSEEPEKLWALISSIESYHENYIEEHLKPLLRPPDFQQMATELTTWRFENPENLRKYPVRFDSGYIRKNFHRDVQRVLGLIWKIHSRLVESFGCELAGDFILQEQQALSKEFYRLLTLSDIPESNKLYPQTPTIENSVDLQQKIIEALDSDGAREIYKIKKRKHKITSKEIAISKIAVEVMSIYYWRINPSKWLQIFQGVEAFVLNLAQLATRLITKRSFDTIKENHYEKIGQVKILPWKNYLIEADERSVNIKRAFHLYRTSKNIFAKVESIQGI